MIQKIEIVLTNDKTIKLELDSKYAPKSVENFINLIKQNYFDGTVFHRIIENCMIQTGGYKVEENTLMELPKQNQSKENLRVMDTQKMI